MDPSSISSGDSPHAARMYDYMLGGGHNFAVDREQVERMLASTPGIDVLVRANRAFQGRVVRRCVDRGLDQFLELGAGVPSVGSVHEIARRARPDVRVAYVDHDPVAVVHTGQITETDPLLSATLADVADAAAVLAAPGVVGLLDLSRPLVVLACSVLHFVPGDVGAVVATYRRALAPGSVLALSHAHREDDGTDAERVDAVRRSYRETPTHLVLRTRSEIVALFAGFDVRAPGVVDVRDWPQERAGGPDGRSGCANPGSFLGGVGVLPPVAFADRAPR